MNSKNFDKKKVRNIAAASALAIALPLVAISGSVTTNKDNVAQAADIIDLKVFHKAELNSAKTNYKLADKNESGNYNVDLTFKVEGVANVAVGKKEVSITLPKDIDLADEKNVKISTKSHIIKLDNLTKLPNYLGSIADSIPSPTIKSQSASPTDLDTLLSGLNKASNEAKLIGDLGAIQAEAKNVKVSYTEDGKTVITADYPNALGEAVNQLLGTILGPITDAVGQINSSSSKVKAPSGGLGTQVKGLLQALLPIDELTNNPLSNPLFDLLDTIQNEVVGALDVRVLGETEFTISTEIEAPSVEEATVEARAISRATGDIALPPQELVDEVTLAFEVAKDDNGSGDPTPDPSDDDNGDDDGNGDGDNGDGDDLTPIDGGTGEKLPKTATGMWTMGLAGVGSMLAGIGAKLFARRKI